MKQPIFYVGLLLVLLGMAETFIADPHTIDGIQYTIRGCTLQAIGTYLATRRYPQ